MVFLIDKVNLGFVSLGRESCRGALCKANPELTLRGSQPVNYLENDKCDSTPSHRQRRRQQFYQVLLIAQCSYLIPRSTIWWFLAPLWAKPGSCKSSCARVDISFNLLLEEITIAMTRPHHCRSQTISSSHARCLHGDGGNEVGKPLSHTET
jgi:hypothetical protein